MPLFCHVLENNQMTTWAICAFKKVRNFTFIMTSRLALFLTLLHFACSPTPTAIRQRGVYYWKTNWEITPYLRNYLRESGVKRTFVKFADIARNPTSGEVEPYALLRARDTSGVAEMAIVPCFFITNNVFTNTDEGTTAWLVERLLETLESVGGQFGKTPADWPEIQVDCDWTGSTRKAYFTFLKQLNRRLPTADLNVTIRLHQYHDPNQTGVPPAERGTLMCYNSGDIDAETTKNSIFDPQDIAPYAQAPAYPLPLDLALPAFSWALIYRSGILWRIVPEPNPVLLADTTAFMPDEAMLHVVRPVFFGGHYLAPNDRVRVETITPELLRQNRALLESFHLAPDATILLYHLDSVAVARGNWWVL